MGVGSEAPRLRRGETYFDGRTPVLTEGADLEGLECAFNDIDYTTPSVLSQRSRTTTYARIMRNVSGGALLPKRVVKCLLTGTGYEILGQFDGYAATIGTDFIAGVIDENLPAAGCPANDLCLVIFKGHSLVVSGTASDINIGDSLVIDNDAGKVIGQDTNPVAGTATFNQINGKIGRALTFVTTADAEFHAYIDIQN